MPKTIRLKNFSGLIWPAEKLRAPVCGGGHIPEPRAFFFSLPSVGPFEEQKWQGPSLGRGRTLLSPNPDGRKHCGAEPHTFFLGPVITHMFAG